MEHRVEWLIPNRVILFEIVGNLDSESAEHFSSEIEKKVEEGTAPVHIIADSTKGGNVPMHPRKVAGMSGYLRHENMGHAVVIGGNAIMNLFVSIIKSMTRVKVSSAKSVTEALAILQQQDATLSPQ